MAPLPLNLPAEVCAQIVQCALAGDLPALARVSKTMHVLAETRLYHHVSMRDPQSVYRICVALLSRGSHRTQYVKRLWLFQDTRYCARGPMPEELWILVRDVLTRLDNLESIYLYDNTYMNTWIFDSNHIRFQLRDAHLTFLWDDALVSFLEAQTQIHTLTLTAPDEDERTRRMLIPGSLPNLENYDGPLFAAVDMLSCPIKRLSLRVDEENAPLFSAYVTELARTNKALRSLNVQHVPEYLVADTLHVLAASPLAGSLRYFGILSLPVAEVRFRDLGSLLTSLLSLVYSATRYTEPY